MLAFLPCRLDDKGGDAARPDRHRASQGQHDMEPDPLTAWYAAIRAGDAAALAAIATPDLHITYGGRPGLLPWSGEWRGVAAAMEFFGHVARHLEVIEITPLRRIAAEGAVVVVLDGRWRARATGREVAAQVANIFTLREGRIAAYQVFHDTAALWEALRGEALQDA
jgi:ketosteroid isomerase-like protein